MQTINTIPTGFGYVLQGAKILLTPGLKRYVLVPLLANVAVFLVLTIALIHSFTDISQWLEGMLTDWWSWLAVAAWIIAWVFSIVIFLLVLVVYGYSFNLITNFIAAPFYGLLAEKIEQHLTGAITPAESFSHMLLRTFGRELVKLWYFISRGLLVAIGLFVLSFIPPFNLLVPVLAFLWSTWVITLQYVDYPADNHQLSFKELRQRVTRQRYSSIGHGGTVMVGSMIPVINILVMPIAVASGTLFWIKELEGVKSS